MDKRLLFMTLVTTSTGLLIIRVAEIPQPISTYVMFMVVAAGWICRISGERYGRSIMKRAIFEQLPKAVAEVRKRSQS